MLKINNLITANIANQELDVRFITDHMGMSRASLYSKLKAVIDMGVNDYINKFRIEKAIYLLIHSNLPIVVVSEQAGFQYRHSNRLQAKVHQNTKKKKRLVGLSGVRSRNKSGFAK